MSWMQQGDVVPPSNTFGIGSPAFATQPVAPYVPAGSVGQAPGLSQDAFSKTNPNVGWKPDSNDPRYLSMVVHIRPDTIPEFMKGVDGRELTHSVPPVIRDRINSIIIRISNAPPERSPPEAELDAINRQAGNGLAYVKTLGNRGPVDVEQSPARREVLPASGPSGPLQNFPPTPSNAINNPNNMVPLDSQVFPENPIDARPAPYGNPPGRFTNAQSNDRANFGSPGLGTSGQQEVFPGAPGGPLNDRLGNRSLNNSLSTSALDQDYTLGNRNSAGASLVPGSNAGSLGAGNNGMRTSLVNPSLGNPSMGQPNGPTYMAQSTPPPWSSSMGQSVPAQPPYAGSMNSPPGYYPGAQSGGYSVPGQVPMFASNSPVSTHADIIAARQRELLERPIRTETETAAQIDAQRYMPLLLLFSIVGNVYLGLWLQHLRTRYRNLLGNMRGLSPSELDD